MSDYEANTFMVECHFQPDQFYRTATSTTSFEDEQDLVPMKDALHPVINLY